MEISPPGRTPPEFSPGRGRPDGAAVGRGGATATPPAVTLVRTERPTRDVGNEVSAGPDLELAEAEAWLRDDPDARGRLDLAIGELWESLPVHERGDRELWEMAARRGLIREAYRAHGRAPTTEAKAAC